MCFSSVKEFMRETQLDSAIVEYDWTGRSVGVFTEPLMEGAEGRVYCHFNGFNHAALYAAYVRTLESWADSGNLWWKVVILLRNIVGSGTT